FQARHGQTSGWLQNVPSMGIVTLNAVHALLQDRVVLGQVEFRMGLQMALEATVRIFARVQNKLSTAASRRDMFAAGTMAGFAAGLARHLATVQVNAGVRA